MCPLTYLRAYLELLGDSYIPAEQTLIRDVPTVPLMYAIEGFGSQRSCHMLRDRLVCGQPFIITAQVHGRSFSDLQCVLHWPQVDKSFLTTVSVRRQAYCLKVRVLQQNHDPHWNVAPMRLVIMACSSSNIP